MKSDCEKVVNAVRFAWCENCDADQMLGQFIAIDCVGVQYCPACAHANGDITAREMAKFAKENRTLYITWLRARLAEQEAAQ